MLNSFFEILKTSFSILLIFFSNFSDSTFKNLLSTFIPSISIKASISIKGFSKIS